MPGQWRARDTDVHYEVERADRRQQHFQRRLRRVLGERRRPADWEEVAFAMPRELGGSAGDPSDAEREELRSRLARLEERAREHGGWLPGDRAIAEAIIEQLEADEKGDDDTT